MRKLFLTFLILASHAFGAFSYIASASGGTALTSPGINTTGANLLIVVVTVDNGGAYLAIYDTIAGHSNTYTFAKSQAAAGTATTYTYYCANPTYVGSGHVFNVSVANGYESIYAAAYSGAASSPLDAVTNSATNNANATIQPGSMTPTCTNELVITGMFTEGGATPTISGATVRQARSSGGANWGGGLADSIQTAIVAINPTWTVASGHNAATIVAFQAADSVCGGTSSRVRRRVIGGE
jgi:hypothetical protein